MHCVTEDNVCFSPRIFYCALRVRVQKWNPVSRAQNAMIFSIFRTTRRNSKTHTASPAASNPGSRS